MAINKIFHNYGESDEDTPIDAEFLNELIAQSNKNTEKLQYITADDNGTHFINGVYANGNELRADDDYKDPSVIQSKGSVHNNES